MSENPNKILPQHKYADPDMQRLSKTLDRKLSDILEMVDGMLQLRKAPQEAQRQRAMMRRSLEDAGTHALNAAAAVENETNNQKRDM